MSKPFKQADNESNSLGQTWPMAIKAEECEKTKYLQTRECSLKNDEIEIMDYLVKKENEYGRMHDSFELPAKNDGTFLLFLVNWM